MQHATSASSTNQVEPALARRPLERRPRCVLAVVNGPRRGPRRSSRRADLRCSICASCPSRGHATRASDRRLGPVMLQAIDQSGIEDHRVEAGPALLARTRLAPFRDWGDVSGDARPQPPSVFVLVGVAHRREGRVVGKTDEVAPGATTNPPSPLMAPHSQARLARKEVDRRRHVARVEPQPDRAW